MVTRGKFCSVPGRWLLVKGGLVVSADLPSQAQQIRASSPCGETAGHYGGFLDALSPASRWS
jgi:hypothetical protein